jgi:hypothetical protein
MAKYADIRRIGVGGFAEVWECQCDEDGETYLPLMPNSDHANFAAHGIPALRLLAGFDRPESRVKAILSGADLPRLVREDELRRALRVTCVMAWQGLTAPDATLEQWAQRPTAA